MLRPPKKCLTLLLALRVSLEPGLSQSVGGGYSKAGDTQISSLASTPGDRRGEGRALRKGPQRWGSQGTHLSWWSAPCEENLGTEGAGQSQACPRVQDTSPPGHISVPTV